ncbi:MULTISPECIES: isocitrate lyase/PEP mutase family protein [unclassified Paenibacillus]|uniref:isocitrate lyase/PEP mutase family protein n=1 Tax=unclassified Paenibacillus TaxID=185978 RepID=UPI0009A6FC93|nr:MULTISPECIES: isocitrate lyase/phosphoenolpyruvate mutase family protein [unclassified Paenibacillus]SLK17690.1 2-Methylisocitrate lyase, PEP mutase family [Paenibacillus sp. RU5A]SOC74910.1 2-Methylisocitrate lyase, PEP mutase family [Paenibacillus sp. RU26A]SOC77033.1 2-Methylisocitrate lyase, PEP mutase family [Paenibacillus sp. RU5M]
MSTLQEKALMFHHSHTKGNPLVLINVWDAGSALAIQSAGAAAIATGSWSVAAAHGEQDGEAMPFQLVLDNLARITASVDLPVTIDIEGGYGRLASEVKGNVSQVIHHGAVGINIEDQLPSGAGLYAVEEQCLRLSAAQEAAEQAGIPLFINARTDIFLQNAPERHNHALLEEALIRSKAYAEAGASGLFVPGLQNQQLIQELCERSSLPVNVMVTSHEPSPKQLAGLGVARVSYGPYPYLQAMEYLKELGQSILSGN